jgi:sodium transport system ATP-binding protein
MIEARGLTKVFKTKKKRKTVEVRAAQEVSFDCRPGEIFGLLGANGAGKTTTLRMLSTILRPTAGTATVAGHDVVREPAAVRRKIGFLSTQTALYGRLSAREMVQYFGRLYGVTEASLRGRIAELFRALEMEDFADRRCEKLSTGQKQKVSIARTLVHDPPVMIFDEPTVGLDVMAQRTILEFVRGCRDLGKTVIFSTHVMSEVEKICDRLAVIHGGRILADGSVGELKTRHGEEDLEELFVKLVASAGEVAA